MDEIRLFFTTSVNLSVVANMQGSFPCFPRSLSNRIKSDTLSVLSGCRISMSLAVQPHIMCMTLGEPLLSVLEV